jgi:hypothetical protein
MSNDGAAEVQMRVSSKVPAFADYRPLVDLPAAKLVAPARCEVRVDVTGSPGLASAVFDVGLIERRFRILRLVAEPADGYGLDPYEVQRLDMGLILRGGIEHLIRWEGADGTSFSADRPMDPDDPHVGIAVAYSVAHALGGHPVVAVAHDLGISAGAAAQRVRRARAAGYLPPTTPGKAS